MERWCDSLHDVDQFDDDHPEERKKNMSFFNWWNSGICIGVIFGVTLIVSYMCCYNYTIFILIAVYMFIS